MMELQTILDSTKYYKVEDLQHIYDTIKSDITLSKGVKGVRYYNIPCAFDIETSSFFQQSEKVAIMYVWTFCINGYCILGRTWDEFVTLINELSQIFNTSKSLRLMIYVHNLSFDFSFFRKWLEWENVFASKSRTPLYALTTNGIEFRCSYMLSGYKLEFIAENHLHKYHVLKKVGDLDYDKLRHSKTPLSDTEIGYCLNDVKVVCAYIQEKIEAENGIQNIPLTKTGYVRRYCRNMCFYNGAHLNTDEKKIAYQKYMNRMKLTLEEYYQLKRAFQGGFTHANPFFIGKIISDVASFDFTSSYPAVMLSEKFPVASSEILPLPMSEDEFNYNLKNFCCLFEIELFDVTPKLFFDNYISRYRCRELKKPVCSNGRVVSAEHLKMTVTEQDFFIIKQFYKWGDIKISNFRRYKKGYLPKDFIIAILKLYQDKTTLKGIEGREVEYLQSKEMLNSCYGMCVTDILRDEITYINNEWVGEGSRKDERATINEPEETILRYNKNKSRFLYYPWGVWVTAYARKNLFTGILEFGGDYIYSDTDSIKVINLEKHIDYINKYNQMIRIKIAEMLNRYNLPLDSASPQNKKGQNKQLGIWEYEGTYKRFKTLGAKRYMVETEEGVNITVSGLNKSECMPYIFRQSENPFTFFSDDMYIPGEYTGKKTHTYIDEKREGDITDYTGLSGHYMELSGVHLSNSPYQMSMTKEFLDYLTELRVLQGSGYD